MDRPSRASPFKRLIEWFWRGRALADSRQALSAFRAKARPLLQRAKASADIASDALTTEPVDSSVHAVACELYRQSAFWAASATASAQDAPPESVWGALDDSLLATVASGAESPESLRDLLHRGSFIHFAELAPAEQRRTCALLRKLSTALLVEADEYVRGGRAIRQQRFNRLGGLAVVLAGLVFLAPSAYSSLDQLNQLAAGKPWRASSQYGSGGCQSPIQTCPGPYFFHTQVDDPSPWVEFDLGSEKTVSRVQVENRTDCCFDRALPLVVELSGDQKTWRVVATRDQVFTSWRATFEPAKARYVRLRVTKPGILHLSRVSVR